MTLLFRIQRGDVLGETSRVASRYPWGTGSLATGFGRNPDRRSHGRASECAIAASGNFRPALVEAPAGAVAGDVVDVSVLKAFAGSLSQVGGVFVAPALFSGGEGTCFGAGDLLVGGEAFEEEFGCEIPDDAAEKIVTVRDAVTFIEAHP